MWQTVATVFFVWLALIAPLLVFLTWAKNR